MTLRALLNVAYAFLAEHLTSDERDELDAKLEEMPKAPGKHPERPSSVAGTRALMAAAKMPHAGGGQSGRKHGPKRKPGRAGV